MRGREELVVDAPQRRQVGLGAQTLAKGGVVATGPTRADSSLPLMPARAASQSKNATSVGRQLPGRRRRRSTAAL